ncbi:MAG TPA: ABC transporter substrate-binding protein [Microbacteriaceae bacterium]|nr:ABC transporter substrate-binding protein [Microbacteriaceae bacterium]
MITSALRRGRTRGILAATAAIGVAALLTACAGGTAPAATTEPTTDGSAAVDPHAPELTSIKVTGIVGPGGTIPLILAADKFGPEYGLEIEFVPADNSGVATTQVIAGDVAAANSSYFGVIDAIAQGLPLVVIAEGWASTPETGYLMARAGSDIETLADLEGKTVNVISLTSSHSIKLRDSMIAEGLDPEAVNWVELPYSEVAAAFDQGTIDASSAVGPTLAAVLGAGATIVFDYGAGAYEGMAESGWVSSTDFVSKNPNTVAAFQCAIFAAQGALHEDRALYEEYFQKALGAPEAAAKADVMLNFQTTNRIDALNRNIEVYQASGLLGQAIDFADHTLAAPANC